jgi:hypothetical protein
MGDFIPLRGMLVGAKNADCMFTQFSDFNSYLPPLGEQKGAVYE